MNSADQGEADKVLTVFTKEFGMLRLFARGTRRSGSKLNKFLNIFSHARFGFVSGRDSWHLIDAENFEYFNEIYSEEKIKILGNAANFIERFHKGEAPDKVIYSLILSYIKFLEMASDDSLEDLERVFKAKVLLVLGYLNDEELITGAGPENRDKLAEILHDTAFNKLAYPFSADLRNYLDRHIKEGSAASHL